MVRLGNLQTVRKQYAKLIRAYRSGELEDQEAKTLSYMFQTLLQCFRSEKDYSIESRLDAIERRLAEKE